jgi:NAD(P)-dependent dehydrogenase (short-subunit alcohol dehydrogenase family)
MSQENENNQLQGKTAIVTGAGRGIGQAVAQLLASRGAHVVCTDVMGAESSAEEIVAGGDKASGFEHDVRDSARWAEIVNTTVSEVGPINILVNNAGVRSNGPDNAVEQTEEQWDRVVDINLKGVWLGMSAALPSMLENGEGRIVNVASLASVLGLINLCAYSASKGGVLAMSRQVAIEYATQNITVNSLGPGITDTPGMNANLTPEMGKQFTEAVPMQRLAHPREQASMIAFLVGPEAGYITGQYFPVDGGWTAH